ncbi:hypothetical protein M427DRAFT_429687 [Gonapodya prolifera JEL478]|uniref:Uncharacterized protein n=1 Tax=Gonapodya prolifera (strain JEL478) TaxID=1344416 RepID=A0A139ASQ1_GONPJ|nr:hypothetical protein M427DRAFT_429687 [Gonapodya prolifera JEL478]|eukprot:KXS19772.1 hypothetical protein M427DRAFT_429687 [Gonapodya prolifera JEL478]
MINAAHYFLRPLVRVLDFGVCLALRRTVGLSSKSPSSSQSKSKSSRSAFAPILTFCASLSRSSRDFSLRCSHSRRFASSIRRRDSGYAPPPSPPFSKSASSDSRSAMMS